jgi:hypothetical protein
MRTQFPILLCLIMGLVMLAQFFVPHPYSQELFRRMNGWLLVIGVFGLVLGIGGLVNLHWQRVRRRASDWQYSVVALVGLAAMAAIGLTEGHLYPVQRLERTYEQVYREGTYTRREGVITIRSAELTGASLEEKDNIRIPLADGRTAVAPVTKFVRDADDNSEDGTITAAIGPWRTAEPPEDGTGFHVARPGATVFNWLFDYVQVPLDATMFSLLAFFIASAAFRAFRARTVEATLLLLAASIVILGLTPPFLYLWERVFSLVPAGYWEDWGRMPVIGPVLAALPDLPAQAKTWILSVPNMAMRRAILLGIGLGGVAQSFRIIFGIERTYLGGS